MSPAEDLGSREKQDLQVEPERAAWPVRTRVLDGRSFKHAPGERDDLVLCLLEPGGLLIMDDLTLGRPGPDPVREWAFAHQKLHAVEILTTPEAAALILARTS